LCAADLSGANLVHTTFYKAKLIKATLYKAQLDEADFRNADLSGADLSGADLSGANLSRSLFIETNLSRANLTDCFVYGLSVWNVDLQGAKQENLIITPLYEPTITVDNL
jgi:uncharacterized protein YjbI with pentapeptide repeats